MQSLRFLLLSFFAFYFQASAAVITANWSSSNLTVSEEVGSVTLEIALDDIAFEDVIIDYSIVNGTAIGGGLDIDLPAEGNIVISNGTSSQNLIFNVISDNILENTTESLEIQLTSVTGTGTVLGSQSNLSLNIIDDDSSNELKLFFGYGDRADDEANLETTVPVYLSAPSQDTVSVNVLFGGDIDSGDYSSSSNTITFSPGTTKVLFNMGLINDSVEESTENLILSLDAPSGANLLSGSDTFTYTIFDDDIFSVEMATSALDIVEGDSETIYVRLSRPAPTSCSVTYTFTDLTATAGNDYSATLSGTLSFSTGQQEQSIPISSIEDGEIEGLEFFQVTLTNSTGVTIASGNTSSVTLRDTRPSLSLSTSSSSLNESNSTTYLYVTVTDGPISQEITAEISLSGTATQGMDYLVDQAVTIPANSTSVTIPVTFYNDVENEGSENVTFTLTNPTRATISSSDSVAVTITDNDTESYEAYVSSSYSTVSENQGSTRLYLNTTEAVNRNVTYVIGQISGNATQGSDYTLGDNVLTINSGSSSTYTTLTFNEDLLSEGTESFDLGVISATHGQIRSSHARSFTINDNDSQDYEAALSSSSSVNENQGSVTLTLYTTGPVHRDVTYNIGQIGGNATEGTDYTLASDVLTITSGSSSVSTTVTFTDDLLDEGTESLQIGISSATYGLISTNNAHSYTIIDNDAEDYQASLSSSSSVSEVPNGTTLTLTLNTTTAVNRDVTYIIGQIGGNATEGSDYTLASNVLTIASGSSSTSTTVTFNDDLLDEGTESLDIAVSSASHGLISSSNTHTYTINDNDAEDFQAYLSSSSSTSEIQNGTSLTLYLYTTCAVNRDVTYVIGQVGGNATESSDYALSSNVLTITSGSSSTSTTVTFNDDVLTEGTETLEVGVSSASHGLISSSNTHTYTINDNDTEDYQAYLSIGISSRNENESSYTFYLYTNQNVNRDASYVIDQIGGNAILGEDFTLSSNVLTISAYSNSTSATLSVTNDGNTEGNEDLTVGIISTDAGLIQSSNTFSLTIIDDDTPPEVNITNAPSSVSESSSTSFTLSLDREFSSTLDLVISSSGNAVEGVDYTLSDNTPSFSAGSTSQTINIFPIDDGSVESTEDIVLTLNSAANVSLGSTTSISVDLTDNDFVTPPPTPTYGSDAVLEATTNTLHENSSSFSYRVYLSTSASVTQTFIVDDFGGSANLGEDYVLSSGNTVTVNAYSNYSDYQTITITNDNIDEGDETIQLGIISSDTGSISSSNTFQTSITDDETQPEIFFSVSPASTFESTSSYGFYAYLDRAYSGNVSVGINPTGTASLGTDYTLSTNVLTFSTYNTSAIFYVNPINDSKIESLESIILTLTSADNATIRSGAESASLSITDDDSTTINLYNNGSSVSEGSSTQQFYATLASAVSHTIYANIEITGGDATQGSDFTGNAMTVTFTPGSTLQYLDFQLVDDDIAESSETLTASLLEVVGATVGSRQASISILDDDSPATASLSGTSTSTENGSNYIYFSLDQSVPWDVYIDYSLSGTATRTVDYVADATGTIRIPAGSTSQSLFIRGIDDSQDEGDETVIVTIDQVYGASLGSGNPFTWTLQDNDDFAGSLLSLGTITNTIMENAASNVISIPVFLNYPQSQDVTFSIGLGTDTTATIGTDFQLETSTQTITAGSDSASLNLTLLEDSLSEGLEVIELVLTAVSGANVEDLSTHRIFLTDSNVFTLTPEDSDVVNNRFVYASGKWIDIGVQGGEGSFSYSFSSASEHTQLSSNFALSSTDNVIHLYVPSISGPTEKTIIVEASSGNLTSTTNLTILPPLSISSYYVTLRVGETGYSIPLSGGSTDTTPVTIQRDDTDVFEITQRDQLLSLLPYAGALVNANESSPTIEAFRITDGEFIDQTISVSVTILPDTSNATTLEHSIDLPTYNSGIDYRLVGFPMKDMSASRLLFTLVPDLGPMGDLDWMLYEFLGSSGNYSQVTSASTTQTGQGFWMASTSDRLQDITMIAPADDAQIQVTLDQGWNVLGNPFAVGLQKGDLQFSDNTGQWISLDSTQDYTAKTLWTYTSGSYSSSDNLSIGEGAWLYVWNQGGVDLRMDPQLVTYVSSSSSNIAKPRSSSRPEPYPPAPPSGSAISGAGSGGGGCLLSNSNH